MPVDKAPLLRDGDLEDSATKIVTPTVRCLENSDLILVWCAFFCDYLLMCAAIPIFPLLDISDEELGWLFASKSIVQIAAAPVVARLINVVRKRYLVAAGLAVEIVALAIFVVAFSGSGPSPAIFPKTNDMVPIGPDSDFTGGGMRTRTGGGHDEWSPHTLLLCVLARGLTGLGSALVIAAGQAHLKEICTSDEERGWVLGFAATGILSGVIAGPVYGGVLFSINPKTPFALLAVVNCVVTTSLLIGPASARRDLRQDLLGGSSSSSNGIITRTASTNGSATNGATTSSLQPRPPQKSTLAPEVSAAEFLAAPTVLILLLTAGLANTTIGCLCSAVGKFTMTTFRLSSAQVGWLFLWTSIPDCAVCLCGGAILARLGSYRTATLALLVQGFFFVLGPKDVYLVEQISLIGIGLGMGLVDGCMPAMLGNEVDKVGMVVVALWNEVCYRSRVFF